MPGHADPTGFTTAATASDTSSRVTADNRASRDDARGMAAEVNQPAPDVWLLPIQSYQVTSPFGVRWGVLHPGVDLGAPEGTPFYAAAAGVVIICGPNAGYGNNVQIDHGGGIISVYGHSSKLLCHVGQKVQAGDLIALVGSTGYSFGPHLHFEIRQNNKPIEPTKFMKDHGVDILKHAQAIYGDQISD
jgi:murein DD-endopeptidase MepM/ murein hydrolase activator NlpD